MITSDSLRSFLLVIGFAAFSLAYPAPAQTATTLRFTPGVRESAAAVSVQVAQQTPPPPASQAPATAQPGSSPAQTAQPPTASDREKAAQQLKREEKQRVLGVVPNFNTSYDTNALPLSRGQKFNLAWHSALDPFDFLAAAGDAGISQAQNAFPGYGQGAQGYAKRFGASFADNFDGTMLGNALFPILLKQDPRYFRRGTGTFSRRLLYSISTTVWCKDDNRKWGPNYSNVLGNLAAGGISNLYYPSSDRGAGLTVERGLTVTAEGTLGAIFYEFWPDLSRKMFKSHLTKLRVDVPSDQPVSPPQR